MPPARAADSADSSFYRIGGAAAWIADWSEILAEVMILALYPPPDTVAGWFRLFQTQPLIGLLDFWGLEVPLYAMVVVVFLALYAALRPANPALMAVALAFALLGSGIFLATNNPFAMLSLSSQYATAATERRRAALLAAGQALLSLTNQRAVGGLNLGLLLVSGAGLIVSSVMRQGRFFSRSTAYVGLLAHALSLADYLRQALTPSAWAALLMILPNALLLVIWYGLIGRRLFQLGYLATKMLPKPAQSEVLK